MWIQGLGVTASGLQGLDTGLRDLVLHSTVQGNFLISHSARNGGFVTYRVEGDGALTQVASQFYGSNVQMASGRGLSLAQFNGEVVAFFGSNINELVGYRVNVDGSFGPVRRATWAALESQIDAGGTDLLTAWTLLSTRVPPALPGGAWHLDTVALVPLSVGGTSLMLATSATTHEVLSFTLNPGGAPATTAASFGAEALLGINTPVAMEAVTFLGMSFVVIAGAGSSSMSVLRVGPDGSLTPTDHVLDTALSRFANVQALATVVVGDHAFVVAGGGDHGVTLFRLLPDGRLMFVTAIADQDGLGLHNVISLEATVQGGNLVIYAGSQRDAGITRLQVDLGILGTVAQARADMAEALTGGAGRDVLQARSFGDTLSGGGGDDILISGPGETVMRGGAGMDRFVIRADTTIARVEDFERGLDRLELSHLPMLRNPGQLTFAPTATGAEITYRDTRIVLTASNTAPLSMQDIFPNGFDWTDRAFFLDLARFVTDPGSPLTPPPPPPPPAVFPPPASGGPRTDLFAPVGGGTVFGSSTNESIRGSERADVLYGGGGSDLLMGRSGDDILYGDKFVAASFMEEARSVFRLYQATLNRVPDPVGLDGWTEVLAQGRLSLQQVVTGFVNSPEFQTNYGGLTNAHFVTLLYNNVLNRAPDPGGFMGWTNALANGMRREDVVLGFSESAEFRNNTHAAATSYVKARDSAEWADDVFRLYQATLGRAPDPVGLAGWTAALAGGMPFLTTVSGFVGSSEFQTVYGAVNNIQFVTLLYNNVLNRGPDPVGLAGWTDALARGVSRMEVVQGFSQSAEFIANTTQPLRAWMRSQGVDDVLDGGPGNNLLWGGAGVDVFIFRPVNGGVHRVGDFEPWDYLDFADFGFANAAQLRARMSQVGSDVVFADRGVEVRLLNTQLSALQDDNFLI